jgi:SAM-dependent methyltransferase
MNPVRSSIEALAERLLVPRSSPGDLRTAVQELHAVLSGVTGLSDSSSEPDETDPIATPDGRAISTRDAARCTLDFARTARFLRGVDGALTEAVKRFPGETVEVLYAGCGPFAPLVVPLAGRFGSRVHCTLVDVQPRSVDAARQLVEALGLGDSVGVVEADAVTYRPEPAPHVVVTETMQRALTVEPQVAITRNLARRLRPDGLLVPERVSVDACLIDLAREFSLDGAPLNRVRVGLGRLLSLTARDAIEGRLDPDADGLLAPVVVTVPAQPEATTLALLTHVVVFGDIGLGDYDSGITCPEILHGPGRASGGLRLEFRYALGAKPGFRHHLV